MSLAELYSVKLLDSSVIKIFIDVQPDEKYPAWNLPSQTPTNQWRPDITAQAASHAELTAPFLLEKGPLRLLA